MKTNKPGLYVHIPFCKEICSYCAFCKVYYNLSWADLYLDSLLEELNKYSSFSFDSIYIGGGTPTSLNELQLERLFKGLLPFKNDHTVITIETNPDLSDEKINILTRYQVNRISIGVQTFNEKYLKLINRHSSFTEIDNLIHKLKNHGIDNINLDLIYGFNDETLKDLDEDLDKFFLLDIKHISSYCLQIEEGTILKNKNYLEADEEKASNLYYHIVKRLKDHGFFQYEVSNFSKPGFESYHNLIYWNNDEYLGVGLSAASFLYHVRRSNTHNLNEYLKGNYSDYEEKLTIKDEEFYFIMLGLRKLKGINLSEFKQRYHKDFFKEYQSKIELIKDDIKIENGYFSIKENKIFIMDYILRKLLF